MLAAGWHASPVTVSDEGAVARTGAIAAVQSCDRPGAAVSSAAGWPAHIAATGIHTSAHATEHALGFSATARHVGSARVVPVTNSQLSADSDAASTGPVLASQAPEHDSRPAVTSNISQTRRA